ncbi:hypothetical protein MMC18_005786 [Xylographa bjoerkii]|nr:hypothetical protein [Xylographa bjoerkii]
MQLTSILHVVLALVLSICTAAPHMLMPANGDLQSPRTFETRERQFRKIPGPDVVKRQDTEDSISFAPALASGVRIESPTTSSPATPVYNASPVASTSIEEIESMLGAALPP